MRDNVRSSQRGRFGVPVVLGILVTVLFFLIIPQSNITNSVVMGAYTPPPTIDIKPGSFPNSINLNNNGNVPVAILGSQNFDVSTINTNTISFAGTEESKYSIQDVNGDSIVDMVCHFDTQNLNLNMGDTSATLTAQTLSGDAFSASDSVRIVQDN